jgi:hypothetical protein
VEFADVGWDIDDQPMPEATACWSIWIITGDGKALSARRHSGPDQMRRLVASSTSKSKVLRQDVNVGEVVTIVKALSLKCECHRTTPLA